MTVSLMFLALAIALLCGVPISLSLGASGALGILLTYGFGSTGILLIPQTIHESLSNMLLASLPLYMLMAYVMVQSGLARDLFDLAERVVRRLPGGLIIAGILSSGGFAAVAGSTTATVSTVGGVALPEMLRRGYPRGISAGALAMAGTLGILIPPSALLILYSFVSGASVGDLFAAGILPGIMLMIMMASYVVIRENSRLKELGEPREALLVASQVSNVGNRKSMAASDSDLHSQYTGPDGRGTLSSSQQGRLELVGSAAPEELPPSGPLGVIVSLLIIPLVVGGIYMGWVTPVESAALGVFYAIILGVARRRLSINALYQAVKGASFIGAMILAIVAGASLFSKAAALTQVPMNVADAILGTEMSKAWFIVVMVLTFFVLGTFLDGIALISAVIPVLLPVLAMYEIDMVWFGILLIMSVEIGAVTPPLGVSLLVLRGIRPDYTEGEIIRGTAPFALIGVLGIAIVATFPTVATLLPGLR
jgi:C4-dicarboxylate transporter DctM subunit